MFHGVLQLFVTLIDRNLYKMEKTEFGKDEKFGKQIFHVDVNKLNGNERRNGSALFWK